MRGVPGPFDCLVWNQLILCTLTNVIDPIIKELQERLHECHTELDYLDKENTSLTDEYSKLRTKFLASEEGVDYLLQRLEILKGILEEKDHEVNLQTRVRYYP